MEISDDELVRRIELLEREFGGAGHGGVRELAFGMVLLIAAATLVVIGGSQIHGLLQLGSWR